MNPARNNTCTLCGRHGRLGPQITVSELESEAVYVRPIARLSPFLIHLPDSQPPSPASLPPSVVYNQPPPQPTTCSLSSPLLSSSSPLASALRPPTPTAATSSSLAVAATCACAPRGRRRTCECGAWRGALHRTITALISHSGKCGSQKESDVWLFWGGSKPDMIYLPGSKKCLFASGRGCCWARRRAHHSHAQSAPAAASRSQTATSSSFSPAGPRSTAAVRSPTFSRFITTT